MEGYRKRRVHNGAQRYGEGVVRGRQMWVRAEDRFPTGLGLLERVGVSPNQLHHQCELRVKGGLHKDPYEPEWTEQLSAVVEW